MVLHERAAELERILARRFARTSSMKHSRYTPFWFVLTPRHGPTGTCVLRIAYSMQQVRHRVADLRVAGRRPQPLQLAIVLAVLDAAGLREGVDRLPGDADVQPDEVAALVDARLHPALRDRAVEVVRHVFLAAPDHLHRHAGKLLAIATAWRT